MPAMAEVLEEKVNILIVDDRPDKLLTYEVMLAAAEGRGLAWLHQNGEVLSRQSRPDGSSVVTVRLASDRAAQAVSLFGARLRPADDLSRAAE